MISQPLQKLHTSIEKAVADEGLRRFAERAGVPISTVRNAKAGQNLTASSIEKLCQATGLEFYVGPPRDGSEYLEEQAATATCESASGKPEDFVSIQIEQLGGWILTPSQEMRGAIAFRRAWLQQAQVDPLQACLALVPDGGMSPLFEKGDVVLLRKDGKGVSGRDIVDGRIYAFKAFGGFHLRRMYQSGRALVAIGASEDCHPMVFNSANAALHLIGDVAWCGRSIISTFE